MRRTLLTIVLVTVNCFFSQSQESIYENVAGLNQINYIPSTFSDLQTETFKGYISDMTDLKTEAEKNGRTVYYNNTILNKYFSELITNYASNTGDLSFSNYTINANSSDKTLTIGGAFRLDNFHPKSDKRIALRQLKPLRKVGNLLAIYVKSGLEDGFSSIYSKNEGDYGFNSDIGIGAKYTHVFNGVINNGKREKIEYIRNSTLKTEAIKKIKEYKKSDFEADLKLKNLLTDVEGNSSKKEKNRRALLQEKHREFYGVIVDKELEMMKSKQLFSSARVIWASFEFYIPVKGQKVTNTIDTVNTVNQNFKNWNAKITGNYLKNYNLKGPLKQSSFKLTAEIGALNTNSYIANGGSSISIQKILKNNIDNQVEGSSSKVFIGDYNEFTSGIYKAEISSLAFNNTVGLSASFDKTFYGEIKNTNWKLGIPFSLKDKDDKPTVNFELQWREVNKSHYVGISVGYNFGKFVK